MTFLALIERGRGARFGTRVSSTIESASRTVMSA